MGAAIGGVAGGLSAAGGIYALIAQGGGATLATVGAGASAWGATKQGLESKALFEKAAQASAQGDEASARTLVNQARAKAVEAGLSGVDSVLAGVAAAKTSQAFKQSLKEAPQSIAQLAQGKIASKVAAELTNNGHEEWRKNYQDQLKAQGKPITEPREKPVPLQDGEAADAALARLTGEGYKGLAVKDGKLVQDINRPAGEIVPALNQKLNGGPAQDYAKQLVGKEIKTEDDVANMASDVHDVWMKHNSWEQSQKPHLFKKYGQLSADEQIKDLNVVEAVLRAQNNGKIPSNAEKNVAAYRAKLEQQIASVDGAAKIPDRPLTDASSPRAAPVATTNMAVRRSASNDVHTEYTEKLLADEMNGVNIFSPAKASAPTTTSIANQNKAKTISNGIRDQIEKGGALDEKFVHSTVEKISNGSDGKPASLDNSSDKSLVERGIYLYKDSLRREANTYVKNSHGLRDFRNGASMDANGADGFQATFPSTYSKAQVEQVVSEAFAAAQPQKVSIKYTPIKMGDATGYRVDVVVKDKGDNYSGISFAKEIYMKLRLLNQSAAQ